MVMLASTEAEVVISIKKLDADPMLLGLCNGVIDLSTGQFREAKREDFITMQANVTYDPDATCPHWEAFPTEITTGNRELIAYKQEQRPLNWPNRPVRVVAPPRQPSHGGYRVQCGGARANPGGGSSEPGALY